MNTRSNAMPESRVESQAAVGPAAISSARLMYWSLHRELWENRYLYLAPLAVAAFVVFGHLLTLVHLPQRIRVASALDAVQQHNAIEQHYDMAAAFLMATFLILELFYCLEALQRERRDRSILFWKSLPVSDLMTVGAKAGIAFVVLPLLVVAITIAAQFVMLLLSSVVVAGSGQSVATYWAQISLAQMSLLLFYHLMTVHVVGAAPFYGWLLMVSAWARRAPLLWAVLPLLVIGALEKLLFNTAHFGAFLSQMFTGTGSEAITAPHTMPMNPMTHVTLGSFLSSLRLWMGLAVTAVFLATAVRLRRYRGPN